LQQLSDYDLKTNIQKMLSDAQLHWLTRIH